MHRMKDSSYGAADCSENAVATIKGTFAIVYTVKNDAALLLSSIVYHAAAGCSRFYVFWDGTTDDAPDLLRHRDDVVAQNSVRPEDITGPNSLDIDPKHWVEDMLLRKRLNTKHAAELAACEGIEWLLSIDPDELVLADPCDIARNDGSVGHIGRMLTMVSDRTDQVLVPNIEVQATDTPVTCPFTDCTLFIPRRPLVRALCHAGRLVVLRLLRSQRLAVWFEHGVFRLTSDGRFPPTMREPITNSIIPRSHYLGYHSYKAFIRSKRAVQFDFVVHRWIGSAGRKPRSVRRGLLLHYDLFNVQAFAAKFRQRAPRFTMPHATRSILARLARELSDCDLRDFFNDNIMIRDRDAINNLILSGLIIRVECISVFFKLHNKNHSINYLVNNNILD